MIIKEAIGPREPTFELDNFDNPLEVSGPEAWIRDIISIAFYEPGTFTADPDLGVHINAESFEFIEKAVRETKTKLENACDMYLRDIPIEELMVSSFFWSEMEVYVMAISVTFKYNQKLTSYSTYATIVDHQLRYVVNQLT